MAVGYATPHGVAGDLDTLATSIAAKPNISAAVEVVDVPEAMQGRKAIKVTGTAVNDILVAVESNTVLVDDNDASAGNFTITVDGVASGSILFNSSAATVDTAVEAISTVAVGEVTVTGVGSVADPYVIVFDRDVDQGGVSFPVVTVQDVDLTGGPPNVSAPVSGVRILPGTTPA